MGIRGEMGKAFAVTSRQAARALEHPTSRHVLLELAKGERSLGELAQILSLSLSLLSYHIERLREFGLIAITSQRRRAGRALKVYRAVAKQFFVPAHLASSLPSRALLEELRQALEKDRGRRKSTGMVYFVDVNGRRRIEPVGPSDSPSVFEAWMILPMDPDRAVEFGAELRDLMARYGGRKDSRARPFLVYCAFARRSVPRNRSIVH
jgi:DNA-binding transcriptional ArsR family regulator